MIIQGFEMSSRGNSTIRIANDNQTESFTLITHQNLPFTHEKKHVPLWNLSDKDKYKIESEVRDYVSRHGSDIQKLIVFGKVSFSAR